MKSLACPPAVGTTVRCRIAVASFLRANAETIAKARKEPMAIGARKLPGALLKHADEQTVLALATILDGLTTRGWLDQSFADWGVIAAPNWFGRMSNAVAIQRYQHEGAWGVSPHLIPQHSLHAMSGTISQALKIHGPNFGVNGGSNTGCDAFLLAAALMADGQLPGLWLLLTGYETEWIPAANGEPPPAPVCNAVALALTPWKSAASGSCLAVGRAFDAMHLTEFHLGLFAEDWRAFGGLPQGRWRLAEAHWLEIEADRADAEARS